MMASILRVGLLFLLVTQALGEEATCNSNDEAALVQKELRLGQVRGNVQDPEADKEKDEEKDEAIPTKNIPEYMMKQKMSLPKLDKLESWEDMEELTREGEEKIVQKYGLSYADKKEKKQRARLLKEAKEDFATADAYRWRESLPLAAEAEEETDLEKRLALKKKVKKMTTTTMLPTIDQVLDAQSEETGVWAVGTEDASMEEEKSTEIKMKSASDVKKQKKADDRMKKASKIRGEMRHKELRKLFHGEDPSNPMFWQTHKEALTQMVAEEWGHTLDDIKGDYETLVNATHDEKHQELYVHGGDKKFRKKLREQEREAAEEEDLLGLEEDVEE